jgi:YVTN family beta-propeller protein
MSTARAHLDAGTVFAGYRIEGVAGQGGMGVVYRAIQIALNRKVALKLIVPELADDQGFRERFKRESELGASIEHPNVIPVYEAGEADGLLFISMRWVDGTDLRSLILREGRLSPDRAVSIAEQIGAALDAAHHHGLVHRDVKPANVLLAGKQGEHAYLTDFGLTKRTTSAGGLTRTGHFVGTPDYMPPEQIKGEPVSALADVYSLGCMLFHSLTGHTPFERDTEVAKIYAHLNDPPPSVVDAVPEAPPAFDEVVSRALAKEPEERYPSAGDLARAARAALTGAEPEQPEHSLATGPAAPATVRQDAEPPDGEPPGLTLPTPGVTMPAAAPGPTFEASPPRPSEAPTAPAPTAPTPPGPTAPAQTRPAEPPSLPTVPDRPTGGGRRAAAIGLASVVALAAAGGALALGGVFGGSEDKPASDGADQSASFDQPANEETETAGPPKAVATIEAGDGPDGLAVDEDTDSVWVANARGNALTRIDVTTNKAVQTVSVGRNPDGVAAADDVVWVTNTDDGTVTRIEDATQDGPSKTVRVGAEPEGIALGERYVWVANSADATVTRIDRRTATVVGAPIPVGLTPIGVWVGKTGVWVANSGSRTVTLIDPSTARVVGDPIPVGRNARAVAEGLGYLWVSNTNDDTVARIDPTTRKPVGAPIKVADRPKEIAIADGFVWVVNEYGNVLSRIDPRSGKLAGNPIKVGKAPLGLAAGAGALWAANYEANTVTRVRP